MTTKDARALKVGLVYVVLYTVVKFGVLPAIHSVREQKMELAKERRMLADDIALLEWAASATPEADSLNGRIAERLKRVFDGVEVNLTAAGVQQYVRDIAMDAPIQVASVEAATDSLGRNGLRRLGITMNGVTDFQGAVSFLETIARGTRSLNADGFDVQMEDPGSAETGERLRVVLSLTAYAIEPGVDASPSRPLTRNPPKTIASSQ